MCRKPTFRTCLVAIVVLIGMIANASTSVAKEYSFDVYLDGSKIGFQTFEVTDRNEEQVVKIRADFKVKIFFITVYTYHHENVEVWRDDCLRSMTASTDDNGEALFVRGVATGDAFEVKRSNGEESLTGCVSSFAYWDRGFLDRSKLLNSQTGEYMDVKVAELGEDRVSLGGREVPAHRHSLTAEDIRIKLWYADDGDWLALESVTSNGSTLRYVRRSSPAIESPGGDES